MGKLFIYSLSSTLRFNIVVLQLRASSSSRDSVTIKCLSLKVCSFFHPSDVRRKTVADKVILVKEKKLYCEMIGFNLCL